MEGIVIHGNNYGRTLGYPTANIKIKNIELAENSVYCGTCILKNIKYNMVMCVWKDLVEIHILHEFEGEFYGENIQFTPLYFIRKMKIIKDQDQLKEAIKNDVEEAKKLLKIN